MLLHVTGAAQEAAAIAHDAAHDVAVTREFLDWPFNARRLYL